MGAGLAGSTVRYKGVNANQIQFGDKLQGLPPVTGNRRPYRVYKTKAGGNAPDRFRIFCKINQLGGVGNRKNSQFAPNADGVGDCPNLIINAPAPVSRTVETGGGGVIPGPAPPPSPL